MNGNTRLGHPTLYEIPAILKNVSNFNTYGEALGHNFALSTVCKINLASCVPLIGFTVVIANNEVIDSKVSKLN